MAGDLEDFLQRAAARRLAKAQQAQQTPAPARQTQKPQPASPRPPVQKPVVAKQSSPYTDRKRERVVRPIDDDEPILIAQVVSERDAPEAMANRRKAVKDAKIEANRVLADATSQLAALQKASGEPQKANLSFTGNPRGDLIRLLQRPGGIKQAILLKEILDPPTHRW